MTVENLSDAGLRHMNTEEIGTFLTSQRVGVLGLPGGEAPILRPMSYEYDGDDSIYLCYVVGEESLKGRWSDDTVRAVFLVYSAESPFNWRSVVIQGPIEPVPEERAGAILETLTSAWRPEVFDRPDAGIDTRLYELQIAERAGIKQLGLPPGFEEPVSESNRRNPPSME